MRARERRYHHVIQMHLNRSKAPSSFLTWTTMVKGDRKNRRGERTLVLPFRTMRLHDNLLLQTSSQRLDVAFVVDETRFLKGSVEAQTVQSGALFSRAQAWLFVQVLKRHCEDLSACGYSVQIICTKDVSDAFVQLAEKYDVVITDRSHDPELSQRDAALRAAFKDVRVVETACMVDWQTGDPAHVAEADAQFEGRFP